jgi:hypothetical protein
MLWHGSRFSNFGGIFSQGLKVAPPEAPAHGHKFAKGIYFADLSGLSICYCGIGSSKDVGLIILNEVALGNQEELVQPHWNPVPQMPKGYDSVLGKGRRIPDVAEERIFEGMKVPCGKPVDAIGANLGANEHIIYKPEQTRMRYLLKFERLR